MSRDRPARQPARVSRATRPGKDWEAWSATETRARVESLSATRWLLLGIHRNTRFYTNVARPRPLKSRRTCLAVRSRSTLVRARRVSRSLSAQTKISACIQMCIAPARARSRGPRGGASPPLTHGDAPAVTRFPLPPCRLSLSIEYTLRGDGACRMYHTFYNYDTLSRSARIRWVS